MKARIKFGKRNWNFQWVSTQVVIWIYCEKVFSVQRVIFIYYIIGHDIINNKRASLFHFSIVWPISRCCYLILTLRWAEKRTYLCALISMWSILTPVYVLGNDVFVIAMIKNIPSLVRYLAWLGKQIKNDYENIIALSGPQLSTWSTGRTKFNAVQPLGSGQDCRWKSRFRHGTLFLLARQRWSRWSELVHGRSGKCTRHWICCCYQ